MDSEGLHPLAGLLKGMMGTNGGESGPTGEGEHFLASWRVGLWFCRVMASGTVMTASQVKGNHFGNQCQRMNPSPQGFSPSGERPLV